MLAMLSTETIRERLQRELEQPGAGPDPGTDVERLSRHHDTEFIDMVYRRVLRRAPDQQGMEHYLDRLRRGWYSKAEIIATLRFSREGRAANVPITGLKRRHLLSAAAKHIPILASLVDWVGFCGAIPAFIRRRRRNENELGRRLITLQNELHTVAGRLQHLENHHQRLRTDTEEQLAALANTKADREDVRNLANTKADREDVRNLADDLELAKIQLQYCKAMISQQEKGTAGQQIFTSPGENVADQIPEALYLSFEDAFRGPRETVRRRLAVYTPQIESLATAHGPLNTLDLGCGRGEWLEFMARWPGTHIGVDASGTAVERCREAGLKALRADVAAYLARQEDDTFHLIEHLPFGTLISILKEILRVLKPGGAVILETPNPANILVSAYDFYRDPTHRNPVHPDTIGFFADLIGFVDVHTYFISNRDSTTTADPAASTSGGETDGGAETAGVPVLRDSRTIRFDTIDDYVSAARDYALIGRKARQGEENPPRKAAPSPAAVVVDAITRFENLTVGISSAACRANALRFSAETFRTSLHRFITGALKSTLIPSTAEFRP
jgi:O-antigen chain-terminating methyltransferase